jgi:Na+/H+-dicarboxylate symporter
VLGVVGGVLAGGYSPEFGRRVKFIGDVFLHSLFMMVVPLIVASMIMGVASLGDVRKLGGIGGRTIVYYTITTGIAVLIGLVLVSIVNPGKGFPHTEVVDGAWAFDSGKSAITTEGRLLRYSTYNERHHVELTSDEGQKLFGVVKKGAPVTERQIPIDYFQDQETGTKIMIAALRGDQLKITARKLERVTSKQKTVLEQVEEVLVRMVPKNLIKAMAENQVLPIILFSLFFGAVLTTLGARGETAIRFFEGANEAIMKMVRLIMWAAPVGIFALVAARLGAAGGFSDFGKELTLLMKYAGTVIGGLLIHGLVVLPLVLWIFAKRSPLKFARGMANALLTAFSTASSSATLPVTIRSVEANGVSARTTSFVCPLGATINMDGTALYEAVAAIFIAQAYGIDLSFGMQVVVFFTATLAAIGAAGIPEAGLVTMVVVLKAAGLPLEGVTLLLVIDWFLDRWRTTVNVWGDAVGAAVIDRMEIAAERR